jgi:hypothetical protein
MSIPEPFRDPRAPPGVLIYSKVGAAQTQLETAIWLWFHYKDPMSIHTLAVAANEVYHGIARLDGLPTIYGAWKSSLETDDRNVMNQSPNLAKHTNRDGADPLEKEPLIVRAAEIMMVDCINVHEKRFHQRTALMDCFFARFGAENPRFPESAFPPELRGHFRNPSTVEKIRNRSRLEFLKQNLQVFAWPD